MSERKGILTPEQEKTLDDLIKLNNPIAEAADGVAISLIDNQVIERYKDEIETKFPGALEAYVYPMVDALMSGIEKIPQQE